MKSVKPWTNEFIQKLQPKKTRYTVQQNNLIIRVQPSGNKSWYVTPSRGEVIKIGNYPEVSLDKARKETSVIIDKGDKKFRVAILGSGNIGTDLLVKIQRSHLIECVAFVGRSYSSNGMNTAMDMGITCSDKSIEYIEKNSEDIDLVFDCTSAADHKKHALIFNKCNIKAIDLTPAQVGVMAIPALNKEECLGKSNINMITCGGQASIPIAAAIGRSHKDVEYIEVVSSIASKSAGPATRRNLDEYIETTENGIKKFADVKNAKAILNLNPAFPCINMQTTIFAKTDFLDIKALKKELDPIVEEIKSYVPGYDIISEPTHENGRASIMIRVIGLGDYLPEYAGNLDIINCAAIAMAEEYARIL